MNRPEAVSDAPRPNEQIEVLYVDAGDEAENVRERLADSGSIAVERVPTATAALDCIDSGPLDCVVSEYELPAENGVTLLEAVREEWAELPFVLFTDDGDETVASAAIEAGVSGYLRRTPLDEQVAALTTTVARAVTENRERSSMLDRMTDAFFAVDSEWRFTYLNERGREVICAAAGVDRSIDELVGAGLWDLLPEAVDTVFYDRYHEAMDQQASVTFEAEYEPLGIWFEVRAYPSPDGLSVYFQDVTERKERVAALEEQQRVLEEMYRVISAKDLDFEAQIDRLLSIGRDVLGTDYGALSRREGEDSVFEIVHDPNGETRSGDRVPLDQTNCERAIVTEETLVLEDIARDAPDLTDRAGFTEQGVSCYLGTPVVVHGEVYGTFCFYDREPRPEPFSDWQVTLVELLGNWVSYEQERRQHESELTRERNRLEEFASVVSHDLRNPLGVALGRIDAARETGEAEHFDAIERSLERMDTLIEDVLAVAREGAAVEDPSPVDIESVASAAWGVVESDEATLSVESDHRYLGDAARFQQLLENLLRNAIQHGGPDVTVEIGDLPENRGFYVADHGPGIPADERDEIFESGFTTSEDGTGFGLRIVSEIAEAHGGSVHVTESADGGARFEIRGIKTA